MNVLKKAGSLLAIGGIVLTAGAQAADKDVVVTNVPLPIVQQTAGALTNIGRLPSNHVTLVLDFFSSCGPDFYRVNADGTTACFNAIPSGQALVITDAEWRGGGGTANGSAGFSLGNSGNPVMLSTSRIDANGFAAGDEHLTSGLIFTQLPGASIAGVSNNILVTLQGYLIEYQ